ncbi:hypothetical protein OS493_019929 [Desmophyllum pertusum]|uniref:Uncharacterized protein n=1 Tax=Desmophyllum pertusum TaxID=174260 RepID=A0A9X0CKC8_9CNID|nr:hypothetical protein OS493_019929 [Desmophyllum pertusum]
MDVQTSDGRAMLLKYVTSYVTKWHDAYETDALYSSHSLQEDHCARCKHRLYHVTSPKYLQREKLHETDSFLDWLREFDEKPAKPKKYKDGSTLVGVKCVPLSATSSFKTLLYVPHRSVAELLHPDHERLPPAIQHFAAAWLLRPELWRNEDNVQQLFTMRGNKDYFLRNIVNHVKSLTDYLHLWQRQVLGLNTAASTQFSHQPDDLDAKQLTILADVRESLAVRHSTYEEEQQSHYQVDRPDSDDDDPLEEDPVLPQEPMHCVHSMAHDWRKFILLCGKPGTGKTHTVITAIREAIHNDWRVAIAPTTGFLASGYRNQFDHHILVNTVHSMFQYPVDPVQRPEVN